ncbi:3-isopropylmalate dehydratase large subunit [Cytophagaceae bacterium DM2B3-1]|uniref:3-isopropylmalate dehydratase large subunit n=2 Tax=Xanthocytophaga TaxID=3078918 RepID=A0ABT7CMB2_9BACT|nr:MULTISPECIES: 3-isopropylmalate dehydratase large subunit [Xanthocytophaga]MDJ1494691.1 3-isopropylmalate dehydratase large subunit [Xanthocytophaga flavus]MDJ1505147.1 3-isopropylmalate dehydratase large subunit [Xanthocytophaga agilis]
MSQKPQTLFDKIWDSHVVKRQEGHPDVVFIDRHFIHEVTSPQAFNGLRQRGIPVFNPQRTTAVPDHNVPTKDQLLPIKDALSRHQVDTLRKNCADFGIELYDLGHPYQGIVHIIGPELGLTLPGMTIVCGDSHTSTHGAFGNISFGIGTSEVEMVLSAQCIMQYKPKKMLIEINGQLGKGVLSKDIILYIIAKISAGGATGYFVEYAGDTIRNLSMEARMTICNMSIEMGARGGMIAPDETTFNYIKGRKFAPQGEEWEKQLAYWKTLKTDEGAEYDTVLRFNAEDIEPMITYGTNPGMGIKVTDRIPTLAELKDIAEQTSFKKSLEYMGLEAGAQLLGKPVDYVFIGSCTNARIEDLRLVADFVKGKRKADNVEVWIIPGSNQVATQAKAEGLDKIFAEAGFELRDPGCSACLGMNEDKVPAGKYCVSTSNRNFEGRQGPQSRTFLASPLTAAVAAVTGKVTDIREFV